MEKSHIEMWVLGWLWLTAWSCFTEKVVHHIDSGKPDTIFFGLTWCTTEKSFGNIFVWKYKQIYLTPFQWVLSFQPSPISQLSFDFSVMLFWSSDYFHPNITDFSFSASHLWYRDLHSCRWTLHMWPFPGPTFLKLPKSSVVAWFCLIQAELLSVYKQGCWMEAE